MSTPDTTIVINRDTLLEAIQYCLPGIKSASAGPDADLLTIQTTNGSKFMDLSSFNGTIQCKARVELEQTTAKKRRLIIKNSLLNNVVDRSRSGGRIVMTVPETEDGVPDEIKLKNAHGEYEFGLLDPDAIVVPSWELRSAGTVDYALLNSLLDKARLIMDDAVQFIRFQAIKNESGTMFLRVLMRTHRLLGIFYTEAPMLTEEFVVYMATDTFKKVRNLQSAVIEIMLPADENDMIVGFQNPEATRRMLIRCDIESNQDVQDAVKQLVTVPPQTMMWPSKDMHDTLQRIELFSAGRLTMHVPPEQSRAEISVRNNKYTAKEHVMIEGSEIGSHKVPFSVIFDTHTIRVIHKLYHGLEKAKISYDLPENVLKPEIGVVSNPVLQDDEGNVIPPPDGIYYRVMFSLAHGLD